MLPLRASGLANESHAHEKATAVRLYSSRLIAAAMREEALVKCRRTIQARPSPQRARQTTTAEAAAAHMTATQNAGMRPAHTGSHRAIPETADAQPMRYFKFGCETNQSSSSLPETTSRTVSVSAGSFISRVGCQKRTEDNWERENAGCPIANFIVHVHEDFAVHDAEEGEARQRNHVLQSHAMLHVRRISALIRTSGCGSGRFRL